MPITERHGDAHGRDEATKTKDLMEKKHMCVCDMEEFAWERERYGADLF